MFNIRLHLQKLVKLNEEINQLKNSLSKTKKSLSPEGDNINYKAKEVISVDSTGCSFAQSESGLSADIKVL